MAGIEISPELGPILRLPAPHDDILLTASREGDTAGLADVYNEPNIGKRLYSIPYPFSHEDGLKVIDSEATATSALLAYLSSPTTSPLQLSAFPFTSIRIVTPNSTRLIGTIGVHPCEPHPAFPFREGGFDLGYVLLPEFNGRGIVTAAIRRTMEIWEELADVQLFGAFVETDNPGSLRVLQKLGFRTVAEFDEDWPEAKGGGIRRNWRLEKDVVAAKSTYV